MSRRRKVERPADLADHLAAEAARYEAVADEHREQVLSSEHVQAAVAHRAVDRPRRVDLDRASYRAGSTTQGAKALPAISVEERYAVAMEYVPQQPIIDVVRARKQAVELVMRVPFKSLQTDAALLSRAYALIIWRLNTSGSFEARTDLTEEIIDEFVLATQAGVSQKTLNTYRSQLRRIMRGDAVPMRAGRKSKALSPYGTPDFERIWFAASHAGQWTEDAMTHVALSGGAGLRPNEINYVRGSQVNTTSAGTYIRVPTGTGEFRDVPVQGRYADVIVRAAQAGPSTFLVMPQLVARRNVLTHLKKQVSALHSSFIDYDTIRARNLWISRLLAANVPTVVIAEIAGIGAGSSTLSDLAAYLPKPGLGHVFDCLKQPSLIDLPELDDLPERDEVADFLDPHPAR
jgi:hypothetical protein